MRKSKINSRLITALIFLSLALTFLYLCVRITYFIIADYPWYDKALASLLLVAEIFGFMHTIGYFLTLVATIGRQRENIALQPPPPLTSYPPIAIVLPSYKEPLEVIHDTLICLYNLSYPNKNLYLLDDSPYDKPWMAPEKVKVYRLKIEEMCERFGINLFRRDRRGAKAGIINDFLNFKNGKVPENLDYRPYQSQQDNALEKYLLIFDADMNPLPDFVENLVAYMELFPKVAFIQTPQYYTNFETNRVARASGLQQIIFFEYICEGKGLRDAMFCCGTNVLMRAEALLSVGGFDETSVTEDFATSLKLHMNGWRTLYYNKICAFGMGPEDLGAYFKQQFRWSLGTLSLGFKLPYYFFTKFRKFSLAKWWEYFLSGSHYLVGWFFFIMFIFPIIFIFFNIPSYFLDTKVYILVFLPYIALSLTMALWTLYLRNFTPLHMLNGMLITVISFPILMKATLYALLGIKSSFTVTPKEKINILPLIDIWAQTLIVFACLAAIVWGFERLYYEREPFFGLLVNILWCFYNLFMVSSVYYFNNPDEEPCFG